MNNNYEYVIYTYTMKLELPTQNNGDNYNNREMV